MMEEAQAEQARNEWHSLGEGEPSALILREPQLAEARAKLKAAQADLANARLQRSRCEWRAPFAGASGKDIPGLGQYVQPGESWPVFMLSTLPRCAYPWPPTSLSILISCWAKE